MTEQAGQGPGPGPEMPHILLQEPRWEAIRDVNRHRAIFAAGARAIEMQLAHPFVAQAVEDAGYFEAEPLARLRETAASGIILIFETPEAAIAEVRRINGKHKKVDAKPLEERVLKEDLGPHYKAGNPYSAHDQEAQKWVAATIIDSSFLAHETFVGPLSPETKIRYLQQAQELFGTMGLRIPLPKTDQELKAYIQEMIDSQRVIVGSAARRLSPKVLGSGLFPGSEVASSYLKLTTIALLPEKLRKQYRLQQLTPGQRRAFELSAAGFRKVLPHLLSIVTLNGVARGAEKRTRAIAREQTQ